MIRLGAALLWLIVAGTALGQRAANAPAVEDAELARAMTAAARALLESVRGDPEFSERLRSYSMEDRLLLTLDSPEREKWAYWPTERSGLSFDLMHAKHRALTHELLWLLLEQPRLSQAAEHHAARERAAAEVGHGLPARPRGLQRHVVRRAERHGAVGMALRRSPHLAVDHGRAGPRLHRDADVLRRRSRRRHGGPAGGPARAARRGGSRLAARELADARRSCARAIVPGTPEWNRTGGFTYPNDVPWDIVAATILRDRSDWNSWKTELQPDGIAFKDLNGAQQATLLAILDEIFTTYRPEIADVYRASLDLDGLALRVDRRHEERRAALLPHPDARLPVRVRQRAGQREPHPRGVAQPRRATSAKICCAAIARRRTDATARVTV